jgi:hypothetical protein
LFEASFRRAQSPRRPPSKVASTAVFSIGRSELPEIHPQTKPTRKDCIEFEESSNHARLLALVTAIENCRDTTSNQPFDRSEIFQRLRIEFADQFPSLSMNQSCCHRSPVLSENVDWYCENEAVSLGWDEETTT